MDDLYSDLPGNTTSDYIVQLENNIDNLKTRIRELEEAVAVHETSVKDIQIQLDRVQHQNKILRTNISSLYRTARAELDRKNKEIEEYRRRPRFRDHRSDSVTDADNMKNSKEIFARLAEDNERLNKRVDTLEKSLNDQVTSLQQENEVLQKRLLSLISLMESEIRDEHGESKKERHRSENRVRKEHPTDDKRSHQHCKRFESGNDEITDCNKTHRIIDSSSHKKRTSTSRHKSSERGFKSTNDEITDSNKTHRDIDNSSHKKRANTSRHKSSERGFKSSNDEITNCNYTHRIIDSSSHKKRTSTSRHKSSDRGFKSSNDEITDCKKTRRVIDNSSHKHESSERKYAILKSLDCDRKSPEYLSRRNYDVERSSHERHCSRGSSQRSSTGEKAEQHNSGRYRPAERLTLDEYHKRLSDNLLDSKNDRIRVKETVVRNQHLESRIPPVHNEDPINCPKKKKTESPKVEIPCSSVQQHDSKHSEERHRVAERLTVDEHHKSQPGQQLDSQDDSVRVNETVEGSQHFENNTTSQLDASERVLCLKNEKTETPKVKIPVSSSCMTLWGGSNERRPIIRSEDLNKIHSTPMKIVNNLSTFLNCKSVSPLQDTPDLLKEKFKLQEKVKINPVPLMLNENRVIEKVEAAKQSKEELGSSMEVTSLSTANANSVCAREDLVVDRGQIQTVVKTDDVEHGVFKRKRRRT